MSVESPIAGWQERFPLPQSLENTEFRKWASQLDDSRKDQLVDGLIVWSEENGLLSAAPGHIRPYIEALDTLIGELAMSKKEKAGALWSGLTPKHYGELMRVTRAVLGA